jgi:hypothetical protein
LAPLVWAARSGVLPRLASGGLIVIERGPTIGPGTLGDYAIGSDTLAETFLACLDNSQEPLLAALRDHPAARAVEAHSGGAIPLPSAARFLQALGTAMTEAIAAAGGAVKTWREALWSRRLDDGTWRTRLRGPAGEEDIVSRQLVLATGGEQRGGLLERLPVAGHPLLPRLASTLVESGLVLSTRGPEEIARRLHGINAPRVAIVGGSHSALCAANVLLHACPGLHFGAGAIIVLHNRPLRVFYRSAAEAQSDGYTNFGPDDICPATNYLFRFAGFRLETRELVLRALGIGGRPAEPRLRLHPLAETDTEAWPILERADLVIAALGYRPRALPLFDARDRPIILAANTGADAPLIDARCRVLDAERRPIPGLLGLGLAAGFMPARDIGGEPSFRGQANGIWLWQNGAGPIILDALLNESTVQDAATIAA